MTPGIVEQLKAARAALDDAIRAAEAEAVKDAGDWRERCQVVERPFDGWDVVSPDQRFRWGVSRQAWAICAEFDRRLGLYTTEDAARKALAACKTPPPGEGGRC